MSCFNIENKWCIGSSMCVDVDPDMHVMWHLASISHGRWYDILKEDVWLVLQEMWMILLRQKPNYSRTPLKTQSYYCLVNKLSKMMKDLNKKHSLQRKAFLFLLEQRLALSKVFPKVSFEDGDALIGSCWDK